MNDTATNATSDNNETTTELLATKDEFRKFLEVRDSGEYNMFSPEARQQTSISKENWVDILKNYDIYKNTYSTCCGDC
tara:strand:+ start:529 stop:762 length:234 start_codon:yes stop_codon:yes gene_type:complete